MGIASSVWGPKWVENVGVGPCVCSSLGGEARIGSNIVGMVGKDVEAVAGSRKVGLVGIGCCRW